MASVSSFTSCKDYDDDINGLKDDVAKRALLSDVTALQTTVSGVKSTAEQALEKATAAATATDLATVKGIAEKAATDAAKGIKDAADANTAAAAAQKAADDAKAALADYAKTSDLADYVKNSDLETKLADYVTSSALAEAVADAKQQIETFVATSEGNFEALKADVEKFKGAYNQIWNAVTNVSLYAAVYPSTSGAQDLYTGKDVIDLKFTMSKIDKTAKRFTRFDRAASKSYKDGLFGDPDNKDFFNGSASYSASKVTFTDGEYVKFPTEVIVRVSPTNAVLSPSDIKLIDGTGTALSIVEVASVAPYKAVLTRAGSESGLWKINLNLKDAVAAKTANVKTDWDDTNKKYVAAGTAGAKQVLYAVAINNTSSVEDAADRAAVSEYGLAVNQAEPIVAYKGVYDARYTIKINGTQMYDLTTTPGTPIAKIGGRTKTAGTVIAGAVAQDYAWQTYPATSNATSNNPDRSGVPAVAIKNGGKVTVDMSAVKSNTTDGVLGIGKGDFRPQYYYVVRDDANAGGSDASELNAWKGYQYEGNLGTILDPATEKCEFTITIPETLDKGDYIGFRIFAVNYDGTLCDPDGEPFEVWVGKDSSGATASGELFTTAASATPGGAVTLAMPISTALSATGQAIGGTQTTVGALKVNGTTFAKTITYYEDVNADGTGKTVTTDWTKAKYMSVSLDNTTKIQEWPDGGEGTFTVTGADAKGAPVNVITVTLTKTLPDVEYTKNLMGFSWKDKQLVDGVYTAYLYPRNVMTSATVTNPRWQVSTTSAIYGYRDLTQAINGLAGGAYVTFANTAPKADGTKSYYTGLYTATSGTETTDVSGKNYFLNVKNAADDANTLLIDNTTKHATVVGYNYGKITSQKDDNGFVDYTVEVDNTTQTIFACPLNENVQKYSWMKYTSGTAGTKAYVNSDVNFLYYNAPNSFGRGAVKTKNADGVVTSYIADGDINIINFIIGANDFDNSLFGGTFAQLIERQTGDAAPLGRYHTIKSAQLISDGNNKVNEYFVPVITNTVDGTPSFTFTTGSATSNPPADVPSTLKIVLVDAFGHEHTVSLKMTVKRIP